MLLPLAPEPFTAPTDRDMLASERREFVRTHCTCIFGYARRHDGPSMSVVYYVPTDGDELLVSTMAGRSKAFAVGRDPKVSRSAWRLARSSKAEQRVVLRCRPYSTFAQPPRHLERNDQTEGLTHWTSGSVPWDAPDP